MENYIVTYYDAIQDDNYSVEISAKSSSDASAKFRSMYGADYMWVWDKQVILQERR